MSAPVTAEEVRQWYASRGIEAGRTGRFRKQFIDGWNKAHPDRPYVPSALIHGTGRGYREHGCRCEECTAAIAREGIAGYHQRTHPAT